MIVFKKVSAAYELADGGTHEAIRDLDLTVAGGEFVAVMGCNGSGKTTLARLCNGLVMPSAGSITVDGLSITPGDASHIPAIRRRVGMVFQNPENQIVSMTVEREIAFGLENLGLPREEMERRVQLALQTFRLEPFRERPPYMLSGGEKQRLTLAAVIAMQPSHLLLDEPTSLLDPEHRKRLLDSIVSLHRAADDGQKRTIVLITQAPAEALFAERLLILHAGQIVLDGPPRELFLQNETLQKYAIFPPVEFPVFQYLKKREFSVNSVEELLLSPIL